MNVFQVLISVISVFVTGSAFSASQNQASKVLTVVTEEWKGYTNKDGTGSYWEMVDEIFKGSKYKIKKIIYPWKRAEETVKKGEADAIIGVYEGEKHLTYPKFYIDRDDIDIIYKVSDQKFSDPKDLEDKRVAWRNGYTKDFMGYLKYPSKIVTYIELKAGLLMLNAGRVDYVIDYDTDIVPALVDAKLDKRDFEIKPIFRGAKIYMAFGGKFAEELKSAFEKGFDRTLKDGTLERIYSSGPWNKDFMPYDFKRQ